MIPSFSFALPWNRASSVFISESFLRLTPIAASINSSAFWTTSSRSALSWLSALRSISSTSLAAGWFCSVSLAMACLFSASSCANLGIFLLSTSISLSINSFKCCSEVAWSANSLILYSLFAAQSSLAFSRSCVSSFTFTLSLSNTISSPSVPFDSGK